MLSADVNNLTEIHQQKKPPPVFQDESHVIHLVPKSASFGKRDLLIISYEI